VVRLTGFCCSARCPRAWRVGSLSSSKGQNNLSLMLKRGIEVLVGAALVDALLAVLPVVAQAQGGRTDIHEAPVATGWGMVDSGIEAWVGKVVELWAAGEDESWLGVLEGWNERGVVLRYSEGMACFEASRGDRMLSPMLILFPWPAVRFVGVDVEELEGNQHSPDRP
jgi:hypothetical protein